jgi:hypothetical protein
MTKYSIKSSTSLTGELFWVVKVTTDNKISVTSFATFDGASESVRKRILRERKESSAFSMVKNISINLLSHKDAELVNKLKSSFCLGITPRQYGYLKGIYERQERSF